MQVVTFFACKYTIVGLQYLLVHQNGLVNCMYVTFLGNTLFCSVIVAYVNYFSNNLHNYITNPKPNPLVSTCRYLILLST